MRDKEMKFFVVLNLYSWNGNLVWYEGSYLRILERGGFLKTNTMP
jgi:hypothetical protein